MCEAYKLVLKDVNNKVHNLTSDKGSEFISKEFKKIDEANKIIHHYVDGGGKISVGKIERFNKTLRVLYYQAPELFKH